MRRNIIKHYFVAGSDSQILHIQSSFCYHKRKLADFIALHNVRRLEMYSEVERLSSKIGKRDPEFTPQNKQRKGRVGGENNGRGQWAGGVATGSVRLCNQHARV